MLTPKYASLSISTPEIFLPSYERNPCSSTNGVAPMSAECRGKFVGERQQFFSTQSSPPSLNRCSHSPHSRCARACAELMKAADLLTSTGSSPEPSRMMR
jgi:hypothetical protein